MKRSLIVSVLITVLLVTGCTWPAAKSPAPASAPTETPSPAPDQTNMEPTVAPARTLPGISSAFEIEGEPFRFVGGFVPGRHMVAANEACLEDLVVTAKENGISVLRVMLPEVEVELGSYMDPELLRTFDFFLKLLPERCKICRNVIIYNQRDIKDAGIGESIKGTCR